MAQLQELEQYLVSSNDALTISLVSPSSTGLKTVGSFHPEFTYTIFGEDEKIFGYKDIKMNLRYRANDMRPHLQTSFSQKFKPLGETEAMDVAAMLKEDGRLPQIAFAKSSDFESNSQKLADNWTPPGELYTTLDGPDGTYEVWKGTLDDPAIRQLNARVQVLVPLLIEGGSFIQDTEDSEESTDDDRWTLFLLYRKQPSAEDATKSSYVFAGYSTIYRFFYFQQPSPPPSPSTEWELPAGNLDFATMPCRTRLSQFIILPPFQRKGLGTKLYQTIFKYYFEHKETHELTIENPNESFDKLRDACDLAFLRKMPEFTALTLDADMKVPHSGPVPKLIKGGDLDAICTSSKIAPRQFGRVLEMHIMSQLPVSVRPSLDIERKPTSTKAERHLERMWQIFAKQRLYRHNRDVLSQMERTERVEKLHQTLQGVEFGYLDILATADADTNTNTNVTAETQKPTTNGKRKFSEIDEPVSKKARVDDE